MVPRKTPRGPTGRLRGILHGNWPEPFAGRTPREKPVRRSGSAVSSIFSTPRNARPLMAFPPPPAGCAQTPISIIRHWNDPLGETDALPASLPGADPRTRKRPSRQGFFFDPESRPRRRVSVSGAGRNSPNHITRYFTLSCKRCRTPAAAFRRRIGTMLPGDMVTNRYTSRRRIACHNFDKRAPRPIRPRRGRPASRAAAPRASAMGRRS
jgi:hypothetical protein